MILKTKILKNYSQKMLDCVRVIGPEDPHGFSIVNPSSLLVGHCERFAMIRQGLIVGQGNRAFGIMVSDPDARLLGFYFHEKDRVFITHFIEDINQNRVTAIKVNGTGERYVYIPEAIIKKLWLECQLNLNIEMVERLSKAFGLKLLPHIAAHFLKSSLPDAYQFIHFDDRFGFCLHVGDLRLKARVVDSLLEILGDRDICLPVIDKRAGEVLFYFVSTNQEQEKVISAKTLDVRDIYGFGRDRGSMTNAILHVPDGLTDTKRRITCLLPDDLRDYGSRFSIPYYVPPLPEVQREVHRAEGKKSCLAAEVKLGILRQAFRLAVLSRSGVSQNFLPINGEGIYVVRNDIIRGTNGSNELLRLLDLLLVVPNSHGSLKVLSFLDQSQASPLIHQLTMLSGGSWAICGIYETQRRQQTTRLFQSLERFFRNDTGNGTGNYKDGKCSLIAVFPNNFILANETALELIRLIRDGINPLAQGQGAGLSIGVGSRELSKALKGPCCLAARQCGFVGPA